MKRKVLWIAVIMLLGVFGLTACDNNGSEEIEDYLWRVIRDSNRCCYRPEITDWDLHRANFAKSRPVWEKAITHFIQRILTETNSNGVTWEIGRIYTNDFGGTFIDENGIFNINVVGNRRPVRSDYLVYRQVNNSYNFLKRIKDELWNGMPVEKKRESTIWRSAICVRCNRFTINLEDESKIQLVIEHLRTKNLFRRNTLNFVVGEDYFVLWKK